MILATPRLHVDVSKEKLFYLQRASSQISAYGQVGRGQLAPALQNNAAPAYNDGNNSINKAQFCAKHQCDSRDSILNQNMFVTI